MTHPLLERVVVVLVRPQAADNVAGVVRAMLNLGLAHLRLVEPAAWNPVRAQVAAHRSQEIVARVQHFPDLDAALADVTYTVGTTARPHAARLPVHSPRDAAPDLLARAACGPVALLFGPEDTGLFNADLDRCHALWCIPTDPAYPSLNLAQAVLLAGYELWLAARHPPAVPAGWPEPATQAELERLFTLAEQALWAAGFLQPGQAQARLRALRCLLHRADPDTREVALLTAISARLLKALKRTDRE